MMSTLAMMKRFSATPTRCSQSNSGEGLLGSVSSVGEPELIKGE